MNKIRNLYVKPNYSIIEVLRIIDKGGQQIALVVNDSDILIGVITDGDIRRFLLKGNNLESKCFKCMRKDFKFIYEGDIHNAFNLIKQNEMRNLPVLEKSGKVIKLIDGNEEYGVQPLDNSLVIMAGGKGKRLLPYTENCPKPMLKVGGKPILERLLEKSIKNGFSDFYISVNYLKEQIIEYFQDGTKWNVSIKYLIEDRPYGTAGSLSLIEQRITKPILVLNGDVLTGLDYRSLLAFHNENKAVATICSRSHAISIPFGVINSKGTALENLEEKPTYSYKVNAGIYVLNPEILSQIKYKEFLDMPDLIKEIKSNGSSVAVCPIYENWLDIGRPETYFEAEKSWQHY